MGGRRFIERYGKYVHITPKRMDLADRWFEKYGNKVVFWSRMLPIVRTFISLPAGVARMPFGKFTLYTFLGALPWCTALTLLGVKVGEELGDVGGSAEVHRLPRRRGARRRSSSSSSASGGAQAPA